MDTISDKRILIVDDNVDIHRDFASILCADHDPHGDELDDMEQRLFGNATENVVVNKPQIDYHLDSAYQGEEALALVRRAHDAGRPYHLIFMDVRMPPGWDGIETVERIWSEFPDVEVVICSAYTDYSWEDIIGKLGDTDKLLFLAKPFEPIEVKQIALTLTKKWDLGLQARSYITDLEGQVSQRTAQIEDVLAELEEKNQKLISYNKDLQYIALHDELTGLPNRVLFRDRIQHRVQKAIRDAEKFAILLLDANNFKQINDAYGHHAGDVALRTIGRRLADTLRVSDTVARLGGDEFAILLNVDSADKAIQVAEKISHVLDLPINVAPKSDPVTAQASIGIAMFPQHGEDQDTLLQNADAAMYISKGTAAPWELYAGDESVRPANRTKLITELKLALAGSEPGFAVYYQPIVDLRTNLPCGVEALARWNHPERGDLTPDFFVPLAETSGLIQQLTLRVLHTVLEQISLWEKANIDICASVNLSTRNFADSLIGIKLRDLLDQYNVSPQKLKLEITESMTISDPARALKTIRELKEIGIQISIDDFGTGYSSLAYLQDLPVDELKIDQMFVRSLNRDDGTKAGSIVKSTIELARNLGLSVVAEGVETELDMRTLKSMGCDKIQGYYLSRAVPKDEITEWLAKRFAADSPAMSSIVELAIRRLASASS